MPDTLLTDPRAVLDPISVGNDIKANAWDAYSQAKSPDDFKAKFDKLALPDNAKADLWDMKFKGGIKSLSGLTSPPVQQAPQAAQPAPRVTSIPLISPPPSPVPAPVAPDDASGFKTGPLSGTGELQGEIAPAPGPITAGSPLSATPTQSVAPSPVAPVLPPSDADRTRATLPITDPNYKPNYAPTSLLTPEDVVAPGYGPGFTIPAGKMPPGTFGLPVKGPVPLGTKPVQTPVTDLKEPTFSEARAMAAKQVSDAVDKNLDFLIGPFGIQKGIIKSGAQMLTDPVSLAIIAGTSGLSAVPGAGARLLATGLSAYFATEAGKSFLERFPKVAAAVKAGDTQTAMEEGGGALADAVMAYGAASHALGQARFVPGDIRSIGRNISDRFGPAKPVSGTVFGRVDPYRGVSQIPGTSEPVTYEHTGEEPPTEQGPSGPARGTPPPPGPGPGPGPEPQPPSGPSGLETYLSQPREGVIPITTDEGTAFLHPTMEADGEQHVVITDEQGEPMVQGPPALVAQWMQQHANTGGQQPEQQQKPQPTVNDAEYIRAHNVWNTARIKAITKYMNENPGADEATATQATQGTYGVEPQIGDYKAPPAPPEAPVKEPEAPPPPKVGKVSSATPNAPTAATPTQPEAPETIALQIQQMGRFGEPVQPGQPQRRVVMFPGGQGMPDLSALNGLAITNDGMGNTYAYRKDLISAAEIHHAAKNNTLPDILGHAELGMGVPDKSQTEGGVAVTAHAPDGTEIQTAVAPTDGIPGAIEAAHAVTPEGGHVTVKTPEQALEERQEQKDAERSTFNYDLYDQLRQTGMSHDGAIEAMDRKHLRPNRLLTPEQAVSLGYPAEIGVSITPEESSRRHARALNLVGHAAEELAAGKLIDAANNSWQARRLYPDITGLEFWKVRQSLSNAGIQIEDPEGQKLDLEALYDSYPYSDANGVRHPGKGDYNRFEIKHFAGEPGKAGQSDVREITSVLKPLIRRHGKIIQPAEITLGPRIETAEPATELAPAPPAAAFNPQRDFFDKFPARDKSLRPMPTANNFTYFTGKTSGDVAAMAKSRSDMGLMISPDFGHYLQDIQHYPVVAIDNGAFYQTPTTPADFESFLNDVAAHPEAKTKVYFVVAPDVFDRETNTGDAAATIVLFAEWEPKIHAHGLPVAFVAQEGVEHMLDQIPWDKFEVLFIGGGDDWKLGQVPDDAQWRALFARARAERKPVHFGRVNSYKRAEFVQYGMGEASADGTYLAYGPDKNLPQLTSWLDRLNGQADNHAPVPPPTERPHGPENAPQTEPQTHWLDSLTPAQVTAVHEMMRRIRAKADEANEQHRALSPPYGQIAVGGAHMDPFFRSEALNGFLRALSNGADPMSAVEIGNTDANYAIEKFNKSRGNDYVVHRAWDMERSHLEHWGRAVLRAVEHATPVDLGTPPPAEAPTVNLNAKLPPALAGAKPRYAYGPKQFELKFENDIDRAAYITGQEKLSKHDAAYLKFAMDQTGQSEEAIRKHGRDVRRAIKALAKDGEHGTTLTVPDMARLRFAPGAAAPSGPVRDKKEDHGYDSLTPPPSVEDAKASLRFWLGAFDQSVATVEAGQGTGHDQRVIHQAPLIAQRFANWIELGDEERWRQEQPAVKKVAIEALQHSITGRRYDDANTRLEAAHYKPYVVEMRKLLAPEAPPAEPVLSSNAANQMVISQIASLRAMLEQAITTRTNQGDNPHAMKAVTDKLAAYLPAVVQIRERLKNADPQHMAVLAAVEGRVREFLAQQAIAAKQPEAAAPAMPPHPLEDDLWNRIKKGDEGADRGGYVQAILKAAKEIRAVGGLQTKPQVSAFLRDYDEFKGTGTVESDVFKRGMAALIKKYTAPVKAPAPIQTTAPSVDSRELRSEAIAADNTLADIRRMALDAESDDDRVADKGQTDLDHAYRKGTPEYRKAVNAELAKVRGLIPSGVLEAADGYLRHVDIDTEQLTPQSARFDTTEIAWEEFARASVDAAKELREDAYEKLAAVEPMLVQPPTRQQAAAEQTGINALVDAIYQKLRSGDSLGNITELNRLGEKYLGGARAFGNWTPKDLFDAMEAGVNRYLIENGAAFLEEDGITGLEQLRRLMSRLTTQSIRTDEQIANQQFSTPPTISYVAAKAAAITPDDIVLEPSAGNGGLAVWPKALGAQVFTNEIAPRRREMLEAAGLGKATAHDGELINALLDRSIQPTVVLMNPPFSASTLKSHTAKNNNTYGFNHVESALQRLAPGGRLVAILGGGQANEPEGGASFTNKKSGDWFRKIADRYNVRANIRISGKEYGKYGTTFATRLIVIDKDGPTVATPESRFGNVVRLNVDTLEQAYEALRAIASDRPAVVRKGISGSGLGTPPEGQGGGIAPAPGPGDIAGAPGSESGTGGGSVTGAGGTGITGIPPRSGQDSDGSELAGGSDTVSGPPERIQPEAAGGGAPQQQPDVRPPRHNEPEATAGPGAPDRHADEQRPSGPTGVSSNPELDSIIDEVAAGLEALIGKPPAPGPPSPPAKTTAPKTAPKRSARPPKTAKAPQKAPHPLEQAAIDAERELRELLGDIPNMSAAEQTQRKAEIDKKVLIKLGTIGAKNIVVDGAVKFDAWGEAMMKQVGGLVRLLAQTSKLPAPEILRQIHVVSSAVAKRYGVEAEATPPESEFFPTGDRLNLERQEPSLVHEEDTDAYVKYQPTLKGPQHPGDIVETKTMATVPLPVTNYRPALPQSVIDNGTISNVQLEAIAMVGQQNDSLLPGGYRASALIGDGTGVGKGREAAGILWDNWRQGRRRLVWVSEKNDLMQDAARDFSGLGAGSDLLTNVTQAANGRWIFNPNSRMKSWASWNGKADIKHEGVIFATYALLRSENKKGGTRAEQLRKWLTGDDNGDGAYVLFDESHNLKNAVASVKNKGSKTGIAARQLLHDIPGLRTASLSATAATEISNLGYLDRLGLWGPGTSFPGGFMDFQTAIGSGRMAAMELVARELKAQGKYISRTLSFKGVTQETVTHELNEDQKAVYRTAARAWQKVFQAAQTTIADTTNGGRDARSRFNSEFRSAQLRFFNVLVSTLKIPTAVKLAEESLAAGKSVVITLVNTNEAAQNREKEKANARKAQKIIEGDEENEEDEEEYDFGPKEMLVNLIEKNYPVQQWADDVDPNGKAIKVPVYTTDADGNRIPVTNPQAEAERDELIAEINRDLHMPGNPLDVLIEALGGRDKVAELTGRKERYDEATGKFISRGDPGTARKDINIAEMKKFQNGDKRVAVLSTAAGTGISLHADKGAKNQQKRVQITLQVGWSADKQMQMFGRTHRTNQAHAPEYIMLVSDLGGEKRFIATIARRLGSLGALTKGQKNASAGADMMDKVNFETDQGKAAARAFYDSLEKNVSVPGSNIGGLEVLRQLGVGREDKDSGEITISDAEKRNVTRLLNRLLALDPDLQNAYYNYYYDLFEANVRAAIEDGTLDTGVKSLPGDVIDVKEERLLATDPQTGAKTFYYPVDVQSKIERISPENLEKKIAFHKEEHPRILRSEKGKVALAIDARPIVRANGAVDEAARVVTPGNAAWRKVAVDELARLNMQPVDEWAAERRQELQTALEKADREAEYAQKRYDEDLVYKKERQTEIAQVALKRAENELFRYTNGYEQVPLTVNGTAYLQSTLARLEGAKTTGYNRWSVTDTAENRKVLAGLSGISLSGGNRLVTLSDAERLARVPEAKAAVFEARKALEEIANAPVSGDPWYAKSLAEAQEALAKAKAQEAEHAPIAEDPTAWAKAQWADQYDAAPAHMTERYELIGGAVLKYWNAIREASPLLDIYTTVDSKTGQRIVGVSVMPQSVNQLIARISGGHATVTTGQLLRDVLINGTPFNLEGGIRVVRGRVAKTPVIQFIVNNDATLRNLKSLGVVSEKGITPVHYLPAEVSRQRQILSEILKAYPVIQENVGEAPDFSIESPHGWATTDDSDTPPVLARYRDGVIYTTVEGVRSIGRLWGADLKGVQLPRATQNYAIARHLIDNPRTEQLGRMIRAHANDPNGLIIVSTGQGVSALKRLLRHERFHRAQQTLPLHLNVYEKAFMRHPLAQQAGELLTKLGYPVERHSVEIGADLAAGEFQRLGLTREQGRTLARVYFGALRAEHGDAAVDRIVDTGIVPAIAREAKERAGTRQESTVRPAGPNTGGAGADQAQYALRDSGVEGDQEGVRRLVRQDLPEGASAAERLTLEPADKEPVRPGSSVTLGSGFGGLQPSLEKLYERDLKPKAQAVTKTISGGLDDLKKVFAPDLRGPAAQKAMGLLRERGGERDQRRDRALALLGGFKKRFLQMPEEQGFRGKDVWNAIETGQIAGLSPIDLKFARAARSLLDSRWSELNRLGLLNTYIENYLPRSWKDPKAAENWVQSWQAKRPMAGREDFRKRRTFPTMQDGLDDPDFTLVPKFDNPVDMLMATIGQMDASITAHRVVNEGRQKGDIVYVPVGKKVPLGLEKLDDKIFKVAGPPRGAVTIDPGSREFGGKQEPKPLRSDFGHGPGRWDLTGEERKAYQEALQDWRDENVQPEDVLVHGQRIMGHYYAVEPYARVIDNDLSRGVDGSAIMGGIRSVNNFMNAMELSLSAYHGMTTALNSSFSDMALGIEQALAGKPGKAIASVGRGLVPFASAVHDVYKGSKVLKAWDMQPEEFDQLRHTDPRMWAIVDALKAAGAKARQDAFYQKQFIEAMKDEWSRGNHGGAILRAIPSLAELLMKPIMEQMVPRVKLSAFAKLAAEEMQRNPTYDRDELRQAMGQIWNSIDNRFGQLVQRNLMMQSLARAAMNAVVGRPGWNLGSLQEIAGGAKDLLVGNEKTGTPSVIGNINDLLHGRTTRVSHKTAYLLALLLGGAIINALTTFILTGGDKPEGWDYIAPRDGGVTEDGRPSRIILPTYLAKDLFSYLTRPRETLKAKAAPLISLSADLFFDRDFYNRKIYGDRSIGLGQYIRNELFPYSLTGLMKNRERHASFGKQLLPLIGIMPAGKRVGLSPAEQMIAEFLDENEAKTRAPSGQRDKDKLDVFLTARTNERKAYELGQKYVKSGTMAPADVTHAIQRAKQRPLVADYRHVTDFPTAMRIYDAATDDEKKLLKQDAIHKANLAASKPWEWEDTAARNIAWKYFQIGPGPKPVTQYRMTNPGPPLVQYPQPVY